MLRNKAILLGLISASLGGPALGSEAVPNWPAPATWSPSRSYGARVLSETSPLPFIGVSPCRIVDTRGNGAPITGGIFTGGSDVRNYAVSGKCGVPASAAALSLNFTVTGPGQTTPGFLTAWPTGGAVPLVSILNWDHVPAQIANAAVVPVSINTTSFTVNVSAPTHVIVDVNGYYAEPTFVNRLAPGEALRLFGTIAGTAIILGSNGDTNNIGFSCGVEGIYTGTAPRSSGVIGQGIDMTDSSGLLGIDGTDLSGGTGKLSAGVRGESRTHFGVLGLSQFEGVSGELLNSSGGFIAGGILGSAFGATPPPGAPWGVWSSGNLGVTGSKNFVEPHSSDPSKIILYASLEGREVGTYFRARARCEDGVARVPVPEDFAMVTDENGLSVQATAIGKLASFAVEILDLNEVVLACSRNVEVFLTVNGIRRAFKDFEPVVSGMEFAPRSPEDRMPLYLTEEAKRRLIANGTYNSDGTVNMETAERVGWIRVWKEREEQDRAAAAAFAASSARLIAPK